jgi:hypothetical protein
MPFLGWNWDDRDEFFRLAAKVASRMSAARNPGKSGTGTLKVDAAA